MAQESQHGRDVLSDLLLQWEEFHEQGQEVSPEELCRDCPEKAAELHRRIHALKVIGWVKRAPEDAEGMIDAPPRERNNVHAIEASGGRILVSAGPAGRPGRFWRGLEGVRSRAASPIAVKLPKANRLSSREEAAGFLSEARKAARLKHPPRTVTRYRLPCSQDLQRRIPGVDAQTSLA